MPHTLRRLPWLIPAIVALSCAKNGEQQPAEQGGTYQSYSTPSAQTTDPSQPTYAGAYPTQPSTTSQPAATTATNPQLAALAAPCQADASCFTHRCNTNTGRCAWPCQSNDDCQPGNQCMAPLCVPTGMTSTTSR